MQSRAESTQPSRRSARIASGLLALSCLVLGTAVASPAAAAAPETFPVTINAIDRDGAPATQSATRIIGLDTALEVTFWKESKKTVELPAGRYIVNTYLEVGTDSLALLFAPGFKVKGATSLTMDFRAARQFSIKPPAGAASKAQSCALVLEMAGPKPFSWYIGGADPSTFLSAQVGATSADEFSWSFSCRWAGTDVAPAAAAGRPMIPAPSTYFLAYSGQGTWETGLSRAPRDHDLATVVSDYVTSNPAVKQVINTPAAGWAHVKRQLSVGWGGQSFSAPSRRTEVFNTDGGVSWQMRFTAIGSGATLDAKPARYPGGEISHETFDLSSLAG